MYPPAIAEQLRARERDVSAVTERAELRGLADADLFALAQAEQRAVVTENIPDFSVLADGYDQRGQAHHGLLFVQSQRYPRRSQRTIGRMVTALEELLRVHPGRTPMGLRHWL